MSAHSRVSATPDSIRLRILAEKILSPHIRLPGCAVAMIAGSTAEGLADEYSDLDLILHYHTLPEMAGFDAIRRSFDAGPIDLTLGSPADGSFMIQYKLEGVDCQVGCSTLAQWESEIEAVLDGKEPGGPLHKAMSGTLTAIAVHGAALLEKWQQRLAAYSEPLRNAMINHHLRFFRLWRLVDRMSARDANLWMRQSLVEASFNVLGVLAGLNRRYFTNFQFKRTQAFIQGLTITPENLADRLESLWSGPPAAAAKVLRILVTDLVDLVDTHAPHIDTSKVRSTL